jgi:hypothetical protein
VTERAQPALVYTPPVTPPVYLAEKILASRTALEGERKQVTVLFADLKGSMELLAERDPEEARQLLDPVLEHMMAVVHRYEGTVNQIMGDGIMALFGAPLAHEDHAVRACYAALAMQEALQRYAEEVRRTQGLLVQMRIGLNSGEVVVRAIGNDLHMDYTVRQHWPATAGACRPGHCHRPVLRHGDDLLAPASGGGAGAGGGTMMDFAALRTQAIELLQREGRVAYRVLQLQLIEGLKDAILLPVWKLA